MFQVTKDGVASSAGLKAGDGLLEIGDMSTSRFTHEDARGEIIRSGNEVRLVVQRYYTFFYLFLCVCSVFDLHRNKSFHARTRVHKSIPV